DRVAQFLHACLRILAGTRRGPPMPTARRCFALMLSAALAATAVAQDAPPPVDDGERSALRAQVLLDRALFSPGEIDGVAGSNQAGALAAFQRARGLEPSGELDDTTWSELEKDSAPTLVEHVLAE